MKKVEKRALMCLLLGLVLLAGLCFFIYEDWHDGGKWAVYKGNRDLLYGALTEMGYTCVHPDGAFYLFMKTPEPDATAFCRRAMKDNLLVVPGDSFGTPGYVRLAYCVSRDVIERSLPTFRKLAEEYGIAK